MPDVTSDIAHRMTSSWEKILKFIKSIQDARVQAALLENYKAEERYEHEKKLALLKRLTNNGERMPEILSYSEMDKACFKYIIDKANQYNFEDEGLKNPLIFDTVEDANGTSYILCTEETKQKLLEYQIEFAIEKGSYVSVIPVENFANYVTSQSEPDENEAKYEGRGNNVTIINNVTKEQLAYLRSRTWGDKNQFSFTYTPNEDGTYNVMTLSKNFIDISNRSSNDDLFSALISEKLINSDEMKLARDYDENIVKKIINFNGTKEDGTRANELYVTSANNACGYLKVTKDAVIFSGKNGALITIPKPGTAGFENNKENRANFEKEIYKFTECRFNFSDSQNSDLIAIYDTDFNEKLPEQAKQYNNIEELMKNHAKTGNDKDFQTFKDGQWQYIRPMITVEKQNQINKIEDFSKKYIAQIERLATIKSSEIFSNNVTPILYNIFSAQNISQYDKKAIIDDIKTEIKKEYTNNNAFSLSKFKQWSIVENAVKDVMQKYNIDDKQKIDIEIGVKTELQNIKTLNDIDQKVLIQETNLQLAEKLNEIGLLLQENKTYTKDIETIIISEINSKMASQNYSESFISEFLPIVEKKLNLEEIIYNKQSTEKINIKEELSKAITNAAEIICENHKSEISDVEKIKFKNDIQYVSMQILNENKINEIETIIQKIESNKSKAVMIKLEDGSDKIISGANLPITAFPPDEFITLTNDVKNTIAEVSNTQYKTVYIDSKEKFYDEIKYNPIENREFNQTLYNQAIVEADYISQENKQNDTTYITRKNTIDTKGNLEKTEEYEERSR